MYYKMLKSTKIIQSKLYIECIQAGLDDKKRRNLRERDLVQDKIISAPFPLQTKGTNLRQLHLHVGKNMQESHHSIPQPAVSETLLVPYARTLKITTQTASKPIRKAQRCVECRCFVTWLPVCTLLKSWRPAWPPPALWRSSSDLPHLWHPSQSSTSRNHWWIPDRRRQHDLVHWMNMWRSVESSVTPEVSAGSPRCWWWCSLLLCSQSESSGSSESLVQVRIKIFFCSFSGLQPGLGEMCPPTIVVALTEKLQKPKEILSELIILQYFGTWGQEMRLTAPSAGE